MDGIIFWVIQFDLECNRLQVKISPHKNSDAGFMMESNAVGTGIYMDNAVVLGKVK